MIIVHSKWLHNFITLLSEDAELVHRDIVSISPKEEIKNIYIGMIHFWSLWNYFYFSDEDNYI